MLQIKKILFPTDFSDNADAALGWALLLAKNFESVLNMFHAVVLHGDDVGEDVYSRFPDLDKCIQMLMDNADSQLELTIEDSGVLKMNQKVQRGLSAVDEILSYAESEEIDLIVMGTQGRRGLSHFLLGSVSEKIVRAAKCPVLTVRKPESPDKKIDLRRIVLPTDFSEHSKVATRYAVVLSKITGAKLEVIHVINSSVHPAFYSVGMGSATKLDSELEGRLENMIEDFMRECQANMEYKTCIVEGRPSTEICELADSKEDSLVVIASHGEGRLERMMLGSTTERVIKLAKSPVLTVKTQERHFVK